jgi:hypothetical protein
LKALKTFWREHWPIAVLLLLLLLVLPPAIATIGAVYNVLAGWLQRTLTWLKIPVDVAGKVFDFVGEYVGKPIAALNTAMEAQPILKAAVVVALFVLNPVLGAFVGLWYLKDYLAPVGLKDYRADGLTPPQPQPGVNVLPDRETTFEDYFA